MENENDQLIPLDQDDVISNTSITEYKSQLSLPEGSNSDNNNSLNKLIMHAQEN